MKVKDKILQVTLSRGSLKTAVISKMLGISRQAAAKHCRELVAQGKLVRLHSTRNAEYVLPDKKKRIFTSIYPVKGLQEDLVFREAALKLALEKELSDSARRIVQYGFTEMLNNAIDHSKAAKVMVTLSCDGAGFWFEVLDRGIGVFEKIRKTFKLGSHFEAVEHLLKGKQSTDPARHSGQGIFFTSKAADRFVLQSARLKLIVDNTVDDIFLEEIREEKGTRVQFFIPKRSSRQLKKIFDEYSNSDYEFDRTKITVHLSLREGEYVSRSQAKRLLFGLEKFKRIVLDFKKVKGVGQGFADEIFRVYAKARPELSIEPVNMAPPVEFMVKRASA